MFTPQLRPIMVQNAAAIVARTRKAILLGATSRDSYQKEGKLSVATPEYIQHGTIVDAVTHFTGDHFHQGQTLSLVDYMTQVEMGNIRITGIRLVHTNQLTPNEFKLLGYADLNDFNQQTGHQERGWFMVVEPVTL